MPQETSSRRNSSWIISKPTGSSRMTRCIPNLLPCRIHHDGPVNASARFWSPIVGDDGTVTAYFRGRKLRGRTVRVPEGYRGAIMKKTDQIVRHPQPATTAEEQSGDEAADEDEEEPEESKVVEDVAEFDKLVVWGHEAPPTDADNPYCRGIDEWISFANALHSYSPTSIDSTN